MGEAARESIDTLALDINEVDKTYNAKMLKTITRLSRKQEYFSLQIIFDNIHGQLEPSIGTAATTKIIQATCNVADMYNKIRHQQEHAHAKEAFTQYLHS